MELTSEEKKILTGLSFDSEEIEKGELSAEELALLNEMRAVMDYLKKKYPSYSFEITGCEPKAGTIRKYNEWYFKASGIERDNAFISAVENSGGKYLIKDDFFGEIIREPIEKEVKKMLMNAGLKIIKVDVSFWEMMGREYGETIPVMKVLNGAIDAGNDVKVFIDGSEIKESDYEKTVSDVEEILTRKNVIGDVYVVILKDANADFAKDRLYSDGFTI